MSAIELHAFDPLEALAGMWQMAFLSVAHSFYQFTLQIAYKLKA
jgi:hypothetical protein